jgi:hypothetical protein
LLGVPCVAFCRMTFSRVTPNYVIHKNIIHLDAVLKNDIQQSGI